MLLLSSFFSTDDKGLKFVSKTNLELGPRFAEICSVCKNQPKCLNFFFSRFAAKTVASHMPTRSTEKGLPKFGKFVIFVQITSQPSVLSTVIQEIATKI